MNKLNKKIKQAFENVTPNVLGSVLSDCEAQKGDAIPMTVKKKPSHILNYAATAAALLLLFGVGALAASLVGRGAMLNPSSNPTKITETAEPTEETILYCPAPLSAATKMQIDKAFYERDSEYSSDWYSEENQSGSCRYYGTYNGYDILFYEGSVVGFAETIQVIDVQAFGHINTFLLFAHKNGELVPLNEAYADGLVTKEAIVAAREYHNQCLGDNLIATCRPVKIFGKHEVLIENAWANFSSEPFGTWYSEDNPNGDWRYYNDSILFYCGGEQEAVFTTIQIGSATFSHPTTFQLYYVDMVNEKLTVLEEEYAENPKRFDIAAAAQLHAECQKAVFGEDWLKKAVISQADASELALAHIMEKTTLTRFHITRTGFKTTVDEQGVYYKISFDSPNKTFVVDINANNGSILNMSSESLLQLPDNLPKNLHTKVLAIADEMIENTSWLNMSLLSEYAEPADIDLYYLFYNGFDGESQTPTEEEYSLLKDNPRIEFNLDLIRLPVSKMDTILQEYFGISFAQTGKMGLEHFAYLEETDCYYSSPGGSHYSNVRIKAIAYQDDGSIIFSYIHEYGERIWKVTIQPTDNGYRILSNLPE